jgi:hypothetical protein
MSDEHNPIAHRISLLQRKWNASVPKSPDARIVRWKLKREESKLFDGFCKLESTPHGSLQEVVVAMFTPFRDAATYPGALIRDWVATYEKEKDSLHGFQWDPGRFLEPPAPGVPPGERLLELLDSFHRAMQAGGRDLVVGLIPLQLDDAKAMGKWLQDLLKAGIPAGVKLMLLDYREDPLFEGLCKAHPKETLTLTVDLDLAGAMEKLAQAGDPHAPDVQFRSCLVGMAKEARQGNERGLKKWGERMLEISRKSGFPSMLASAHLVYAGMLFHFKRDKEIQDLLAKGLRIARQGLGTDDDAFIPIHVQLCGFTAANHHLNKRSKEAIQWYLTQAEFCGENGFILQAISAYSQALGLLRQSDRNTFEMQLKKAIDLGAGLTAEELRASSYVHLADDYCTAALKKREWQPLATVLDGRMQEAFGPQWQPEARALRQEYTKKSPQPKFHQ